jgi:hypothetical protein
MYHWALVKSAVSGISTGFYFGEDLKISGGWRHSCDKNHGTATANDMENTKKYKGNH